MRYHALIFVITLATFVLIALPALAFLHPQYIVPDACRGANITKPAEQGGCTICHIAILAINITRFLMVAVAIPAVGLLVAIGGIMLLISGGSETMVTRGRNILKYAIGGALVVFLAWLAVDTLIKLLVGPGQKGFIGALGPWNQVPIERCEIK